MFCWSVSASILCYLAHNLMPVLLKKALPHFLQIQGLNLDFQDLGGGFNKGRGNLTPVGAIYLQNLPKIYFLTDIKIKYNDKIVGYIISQ